MAAIDEVSSLVVRAVAYWCGHGVSDRRSHDGPAEIERVGGGPRTVSAGGVPAGRNGTRIRPEKPPRLQPFEKAA